MDKEQFLYHFFVEQKNDSLGDNDACEMLEVLNSTSIDEIYRIIYRNKGNLIAVSAHNIPQYSKLIEVFRVLDILINAPEHQISREDLGYFLSGEYIKAGAKIKYAENHYKLAAQFGLVKDQLKLEINDFGMALFLIDNSTKQYELLRRLALRVPIIQTAITKANDNIFDLHAFMRQFLSESTAVRRRSNVKTLLTLIDEVAGPELQNAISNIVWGEIRNDII